MHPGCAPCNWRNTLYALAAGQSCQGLDPSPGTSAGELLHTPQRISASMTTLHAHPEGHSC